MSIYALTALNTAMNQMKNNEFDAQNFAQNKERLAQAQQQTQLGANQVDVSNQTKDSTIQASLNRNNLTNYDILNAQAQQKINPELIKQSQQNTHLGLQNLLQAAQRTQMGENDLDIARQTKDSQIQMEKNKALASYYLAGKAKSDIDLNTAQLDQSRAQTDQLQETLKANKALDTAKIKQAHVEGMLSDVTSDALTESMNKRYKAHQDVLDAHSQIQDNLKLSLESKGQQLQQFSNNLSNMLFGINGQNTPTYQQSNQNTELNLPGINTQQSQGINNQGISQAVQQPVNNEQSNISSNVSPSQGSPTYGTHGENNSPDNKNDAMSSSPLVNASNSMANSFGMPSNSMWINPSTGNFEMSPMWKAQMEAHQRAQANYDVNHPYQEVKQQEALEKQYADRLDKGISNRSGGFGLMDAKVNQATLAQQLLDQYYDPNTGEYHVPKAQYTDLAISLATLLAPTSQASDSKVEAIKQKTMQGDFNGILQYITGSPKDATTPKMIQNLADSIKREGLQAEKQRDVYLTMVRAQAPKDLNKEARDRLEFSSIYPSFRKYLETSVSQKNTNENDIISNQKNHSHLWE